MSVAQNLVRLSLSRARGDNTADCPTLYELLSQLGQGGCADTRDRICSLRGLFLEGPNLQVDYLISTPALFFNVLLALERKRGYRDCLVLRHALSLTHQDLENYWTSNKRHNSNFENITIHLAELKSIKEWSNPLAPEIDFTPLHDEIRSSDYI
ncbi:hypothetical protein COCSADRAFT_347803 [Bipolaris sorokiniana ND90Pr]|uniref:Uncharacterized protein n=1 Tax=Cochliobolus sativus (strain ND90Pr / ATCC 201652) TaxID=665912 RepID=M2SR61_COCSN|nr:uncharacterized protein COCSADRAFT_347803 [Bipolaris sorokiniana ND90Pr]EMD59267.1 hypothetical protein COCSADRAFT_347803 [Bipolaris sorokiniana ND90Pr]